MNLIEEIEAAARRGYTGHTHNKSDRLMLDLTIDNRWKRIKDALEAAQQMDAEFSSFMEAYCQPKGRIALSQRKFREAMQ